MRAARQMGAFLARLKLGNDAADLARTDVENGDDAGPGMAGRCGMNICLNFPWKIRLP
jgi:hypothetical protein